MTVISCLTKVGRGFIDVVSSRVSRQEGSCEWLPRDKYDLTNFERVAKSIISKSWKSKFGKYRSNGR